MNKSIKTAFLTIMMVVVFMSGAITSQAQSFDKTEMLQIYKKALELNRGRFADLNHIMVGDTVLLPAYYWPGIVAWVADKPVTTDKGTTYDCIWVISEKHAARSLTTIPVDTLQVRVPAPTPEPEVSEAKTGMAWYHWPLIGASLILLALFLIALFWYNLFKRPANPDSFQPVGGNIDAMPRENTLTSTMMRYLRPGERLINFRTGTLGNSLGKRRITVNMEFGDNVRRDVWLNAGERVSTAIIEDQNGNRRTQHLRNACSNGFGGGSFELPNGWFITYDQSEEAGRVTTEDDGQGGQRLVVTPTTPAPVPAPTPVPAPFQGSLNGLVQVVQGLQIDKGSNVDISLKENKDELSLTIKIGKMRRESSK